MYQDHHESQKRKRQLIVPSNWYSTFKLLTVQELQRRCSASDIQAGYASEHAAQVQNRECTEKYAITPITVMDIKQDQML